MADTNLRKKAVLAMEFLIRSMNDEEIMDGWLMCGVPDGDIDYASEDTSQVDDYFVEDDNFKSLMGLFLRSMSKADKSGGLYIDGVVSK